MEQSGLLKVESEARAAALAASMRFLNEIPKLNGDSIRCHLFQDAGLMQLTLRCQESEDQCE